RRAITVSLAAPDDDLVPCEVDVLHTETAAFEESEPRAVEQRRHQPRRAVELCKDGTHLVAREDGRQATRRLGANEVVEPWEILPENLAIQEEESGERLVLRRRG